MRSIASPATVKYRRDNSTKGEINGGQEPEVEEIFPGQGDREEPDIEAQLPPEVFPATGSSPAARNTAAPLGGKRKKRSDALPAQDTATATKKPARRQASKGAGTEETDVQARDKRGKTSRGNTPQGGEEDRLPEESAGAKRTTPRRKRTQNGGPHLPTPPAKVKQADVTLRARMVNPAMETWDVRLEYRFSPDEAVDPADVKRRIYRQVGTFGRELRLSKVSRKRNQGSLRGKPSTVRRRCRERTRMFHN